MRGALVGDLLLFGCALELLYWRIWWCMLFAICAAFCVRRSYLVVFRLCACPHFDSGPLGTIVCLWMCARSFGLDGDSNHGADVCVHCNQKRRWSIAVCGSSAFSPVKIRLLKRVFAVVVEKTDPKPDIKER